MKKVFKTLGMVALSATVFVSCVENEESEGVLALRQAQAELIKASASKLTAEMQQTLENINTTKISNGVAQLQLDIATASKDAQIAVSQQQYEVAKELQLKSFSEYELAIAKNKVEIEKQQGLLDQAIVDNTNQMDAKTTSYISSYKSYLSTVNSYAETIALEQYKVDVASTIDNNTAYDEDGELTKSTLKVLLASEQKSLDLANVALIYDQKSLDSLINIKSLYTATVADVDNVDKNLASALTNQTTAKAAYHESSVAVNEASNTLLLAQNSLVELQNATTPNTTAITAQQKVVDAAQKVYDDLNYKNGYLFNALSDWDLLVKNLLSLQLNGTKDVTVSLKAYDNAIATKTDVVAKDKADIAKYTTNISDITTYNATKLASYVANKKEQIANMNVALVAAKAQLTKYNDLIQASLAYYNSYTK